jgi:hypothetical protein
MVKTSTAANSFAARLSTEYDTNPIFQRGDESERP